MPGGPTIEPRFPLLAQAVRETRLIGLEVIARLTGIADADDLEHMRQNKAYLLEAAELLAELVPHEALVRSIVRVGALAELPEFSPDVRLLRVGMPGLVRGVLAEEHVDQCQFEFRAPQQRPRVWVRRSDILGVERTPPSMWR